MNRKQHGMFIACITLIGLVITLAFAPSVALAAADPPGTPAASTPTATTTVQGRIVNRTPEGTVPPSLTVMIHAWDTAGLEQLARPGTANPDGTFRFDDVPVSEGWTYAVMTIYQEVTYFSEPFNLSPDEPAPEIEVPIYEITDDSSTVLIDRLHIFFDVTPEGVIITEVYIISNTGDRTIFEAVTLNDGSKATLIFPLPLGASDIRFNQNLDGEFVLQPGGFADRMPLIPGEGVRQVFVSYTLPYQDNLIYRHEARYPIKGVTALIPSATAIALSGEGLVFAGQQTTPDGLSIDVYTREGVNPGQAINISLKGTPNFRVGNTVGRMDTATQSRPWDVVIGGGILGLTLIGLGLWWMRRSQATAPQPQPASGTPSAAQPSAAAVADVVTAFDQVISEIAALDDAFERGDIPEKEYRQQREALRQRARELLAEAQRVPGGSQ